MIVIVPAEELEEAKGMQKILNFAEIFDTLHPDGEKSQILFILTPQIEYAPKRITALLYKAIPLPLWNVHGSIPLLYPP